MLKEERKYQEYKTSENNNSVIEVHNLKKGFGSAEVIKGVSFKLHKKENIAILGKSGTGKSVLIKSIIGLHEPDDGELIILGQNIGQTPENGMDGLRRKIGYLFQGGALYDSMTVRENLEFPLKRQSKKMSQAELNQAVEDSLNDVGLIQAVDKLPSELSGGMQKRIALARTLIMKPQIVLYDEPTTGLDPVTSKEISQLILEMQQKFEISSITITHDISCVKITADRIFIIKDGVFGIEGTYDELKNSDEEWVREFFN